MRQLLICLSCVFFYYQGNTQNLDSHTIDSLLSIPQTIELKISSPQPRLKEKIELSIDINYIRAQIFKSEIGKFEIAEDIGETDGDLMIMKVHALKKGKQSIGPLYFTMNGTQYSTNKVDYEVIDAIPNVDKGVWIRNVKPNDSTLCIIVEQRIPAKSRITQTSATTTKYWTEPENNETIVMSSIPIDGLEYHTSTNSTNQVYFYTEKGKRVNYLNGYSINYYKIVDKRAKIELTKNNFLNLPTDYKFQDIIIE